MAAAKAATTYERPAGLATFLGPVRAETYPRADVAAHHFVESWHCWRVLTGGCQTRFCWHIPVTKCNRSTRPRIQLMTRHCRQLIARTPFSQERKSLHSAMHATIIELPHVLQPRSLAASTAKRMVAHRNLRRLCSSQLACAASLVLVSMAVVILLQTMIGVG